MPLRPVRELSTGWFVLVCVVVAALAVAAVSFAASPLPRITPDSASYLTGAEMLANDGTFAACAGPITLFAPGYSAALAPLGVLGLDTPDAARIVNALATLVLVLGSGALARAAGLSRLASALVAVGVALSYATLRNGALVWSEPLFCSLLAALLVALVNDGRGLPLRISARLTLVLVLTWALLLTRHSGVFLLPAIVAGAWLGSTGLDRRVARIAGYSLGLVAVPALWWARNVDVDSSPFGRRSEANFSISEIASQLPDGLSSLALPAAVPLAVRLLVLAPLVVAALRAWPRSRGSARARLTVCVLGTAALVYGAAVTVAATRTVVDPIDTRLLSPLLVPAAVLVAIGVAGPKVTRPQLGRALTAFALGLVAAMAVLAPGISWRGHEKARTVATIEEDVSCAEWPARYSGLAVRLPNDHG
jgi:hypothetical protein